MCCGLVNPMYRCIYRYTSENIPVLHMPCLHSYACPRKLVRIVPFQSSVERKHEWKPGLNQNPFFSSRPPESRVQIQALDLRFAHHRRGGGFSGEGMEACRVERTDPGPSPSPVHPAGL